MNILSFNCVFLPYSAKEHRAKSEISTKHTMYFKIYLVFKFLIIHNLQTVIPLNIALFIHSRYRSIVYGGLVSLSLIQRLSIGTYVVLSEIFSIMCGSPILFINSFLLSVKTSSYSHPWKERKLR